MTRLAEVRTAWYSGKLGGDLACGRALGAVRPYRQRSGDSTFEIPKQLRLISQLRVRGFEKPGRRWTSARVVPRRDDAEPFANQVGGGMARRPRPLQGADIFFVQANRRRR